MCNDRIKEIEKRLENIEFRQDLLFYQSNVNRVLYEYNVTKSQYNEIMDEMDRIRKKIANGEEVIVGEFEENIKRIMYYKEDIDYHFCEYITRAFMEDYRWEEVFKELYGTKKI